MRVPVPQARLSTATLQAVYPWLASHGLGDDGIYIGAERGGAAWCFDPWALYERGVLTNPNMLIAGEIGSAKSALVKTFVWRQRAVGRRAWVIDPKGEYHALAAACGVVPVRLGGDSPVRINPLDVAPDTTAVNGDSQRRRRAGLIAALAASTLERQLTPAETLACELAVRAAERTGRLSLGGVVDALLTPDDTTARELQLPVTDAAAAAREPALALRRLVHGDLAGVFADETSPQVDLTAGLVVLDLSALLDTDAEPMAMLCAHSWLQHAIAASPDRMIVVLDEAWRVLRHLHTARWLRASWKLARAWGVCNIAVIHRLSDLHAAGVTGSEQAKLARGLLADSQTRVIYHQPVDVVDEMRDILGLGAAEAAALPQLPRGCAVWRVGNCRAVVTHRLLDDERVLVDTDQHMAA